MGNIRSNPVLWRIARWLFDNLDEDSLNGEIGHWVYHEHVRNWWYDKAAILYGKFLLNDFTSKEDNHND
jgi:hypothetical protein